MSNLISAGLLRLWKSTIFLVGILATLCCTLGWSIMMNFNPWALKSPDILLVIDTPVSFIAAICIAVLIGKDYRSSTIRNKLIVGHSRLAIYLSNVIVCSIFSILLYLERILIVLAVAVPIHGVLSQSLAENLQVIAACIMCVLAFTSVYVLIAMLISDMTAGTVGAILLALGMFFASVWVYGALLAPEYLSRVTETDGKTVVVEYRNPDYVTQPARTAYLLLRDTLPNGQMLQLAENVGENTRRNGLTFESDVIFYDLEKQTSAGEMMQLSFAVVLASTACGAFTFRRKNLK